VQAVQARGKSLVTGAVVIVSVLATTAGQTSEARASRAPAPRWSRSDLRPVSQPAAVADRFVQLVARGGELGIVALDAASGSTAWSDIASSSQVAPGEPPTFAIAAGAAIYLRKIHGDIAELVAREVQTGRRIWHGNRGTFSSWPTVCPGARLVLCLSGALASKAASGLQLRFDALTGKRLKGPFITDSGGRLVGAALFDPGRRDPELLVATSGSRVAWRRALREIFPLPGASTDWGWNFDRAGGVGLYIGSPGWRPVSRSGRRLVVDLSRAMTAGFRIGDGAVVWRNRGASYVCNYLPCAGGLPAGFSGPLNASWRGPTVGLRARERGTARGEEGKIQTTLSAGTRTTLEGFDPATGHTRWSFPAGRNVGLITRTLLPPQLGAATIALADAAGQLRAVDLADGSRRALRPSAPAWCRKVVLYEQKVPYTTANASITTYVGQYALFPCRADGRRRPTPRGIPPYVGAIGASTAGRIAWSDTTAVNAAPASP
jgi:putative pyrroloquinoline-quinone binding quinoprotein